MCCWFCLCSPKKLLQNSHGLLDVRFQRGTSPNLALVLLQQLSEVLSMPLLQRLHPVKVLRGSPEVQSIDAALLKAINNNNLYMQ